MADNAEQLVTLIREIIKEEIEKQDTTVPCVVESINVDNTVNLYIMPDMQNVITNILKSIILKSSQLQWVQQP